MGLPRFGKVPLVCLWHTSQNPLASIMMVACGRFDRSVKLGATSELDARGCLPARSPWDGQAVSPDVQSGPGQLCREKQWVPCSYPTAAVRSDQSRYVTVGSVLTGPALPWDWMGQLPLVGPSVLVVPCHLVLRMVYCCIYVVLLQNHLGFVQTRRSTCFSP